MDARRRTPRPARARSARASQETRRSPSGCAARRARAAAKAPRAPSRDVSRRIHARTAEAEKGSLQGRGTGARHQLGGRALSAQLAAQDEQAMVAGALGFIEVVRGHQYASLFRDATEQLAQLALADRIQPGIGLIEQQ